MDMEKTINEAFDEAITEVWNDDDYFDMGYNNGLEEGRRIVLALLKEQEAVVPVYTTNSHPFHIGILYCCGNCHHSLIRDEDLFCRHCGKPIDWTKKAVKLE